jgi:hypothetical protein
LNLLGNPTDNLPGENTKRGSDTSPGVGDVAKQAQPANRHRVAAIPTGQCDFRGSLAAVFRVAYQSRNVTLTRLIVNQRSGNANIAIRRAV